MIRDVDPRAPAHPQAETATTVVSPADSFPAVASGPRTFGPVQETSRPEQLQLPISEWDGTLPVPYGVVPY